MDHSDNDIFVHIDKKSMDFSEKEFSGLCKFSKVSFFQEYKVYWGGYSQAQAELLLFKEAFKNSYDYYHLISGMDLPLMSMDNMHKFIEERKGMEFIDYDNDKIVSDPEILRRTRLFHFLQNYNKSNLLNTFFTTLESICVHLSGFSKLKK